MEAQMKPAIQSSRRNERTKLLVISDKISHTSFGEIAAQFNARDVLVINSSATLPSSLNGRVQRTREEIEIRLAAYQGGDSKDLRKWAAITFGVGEWRVKTENRVAPPVVVVGDLLDFGGAVTAEILLVDHTHPRKIQLQFQGDNFIHEIYRIAKPIQYSYLTSDLHIWDQQTIFSSVPVSVEPPSGSFAVTHALLEELGKLGVEIIPILHSAGISSSGDKDLDRAFPLNEFYEISERSACALNRAIKGGKRITALGTSVVRAVESSFDVSESRIRRGPGISNLRIDSKRRLNVVDRLVTGLHDSKSSHMSLLGAFAPEGMIRKAYEEAEVRGYLNHEYGDLSLVGF